MKNGPWYITIIFSQLSGHDFEDHFTTGLKDRYELICAANVYVIIHTSGLVDASSGGVRPFTSTSSTDSFSSLGHKIKFIDNWLLYFSENYAGRNFIQT